MSTSMRRAVDRLGSVEMSFGVRFHVEVLAKVKACRTVTDLIMSATLLTAGGSCYTGAVNKEWGR